MAYMLLLLLTAIIVTGSQVVAASNPVYSVFWLVLTFLEASILFIILQLDFLALMTVIVYVGAIAMLFLFVILMLQLDNVEMIPWLPFFPALLLLNSLLFFAALWHHWPLTEHHYSNLAFSWTVAYWNNIQSLGFVFYNTYPELFLGAGIMLLVAMVGAMLLSKVTSSLWLSQQDPSKQIHSMCDLTTSH